jgi:hypothetical protein
MSFAEKAGHEGGVGTRLILRSYRIIPIRIALITAECLLSQSSF